MNLGDEVIVKDPDILGGTPVFRGTRVPFQALLDYLEGGQTLGEFIDDFPTVTQESAISALELAKSLLVGQLPHVETPSRMHQPLPALHFFRDHWLLEPCSSP